MFLNRNRLRQRAVIRLVRPLSTMVGYKNTLFLFFENRSFAHQIPILQLVAF